MHDPAEGISPSAIRPIRPTVSHPTDRLPSDRPSAIRPTVYHPTHPTDRLPSDRPSAIRPIRPTVRYLNDGLTDRRCAV
ncbi:hypothetical protein BV898_13566 [Hypsibius exemplaris]|uniref:Uncharacterized protein n=1 Tax=Hypsibius exemplaris TaxID=2072580 RepID=A0A1W0WAA7_HYPEX|nr:hypothetical protein BV898_13566 [Hypsibius exemplaris]